VLTKARGARSTANLKRGGGKSTGRPLKNDPARVTARKLLSNPKYRKMLAQKLNDLTLHPSVHVALMYYAWGKPKETIETNQACPVKIVWVGPDDVEITTT
jgi:hypothetical protein